MNRTDEIALKQMRKKMFLTACRGSAAHLASAFSATELFYALYYKGVLKGNPQDEDRDRLILSKGHASLALYVSLAEKGWIAEEELSTFIQPDTRLGGEPCPTHVPGIEAATGSLGHGLSIGMGIALGGKLDQKEFKTYVILGDGECQEGTIWEAVMAAHKFKLKNLTAILDCNRIQKMGFLKDTMDIEDWASKWSSFGWHVEEIKDGHDLDEIISVLTKVNPTEEPRLVIANTVKGKGVSIMENQPDWHFKLPNRRETKKFLQELDITQEELDACKEHI